MAKRKNTSKKAEPVAADTADAAVVPTSDTPPVNLVRAESKTATLSASAIRKDGGDPGLHGFDANDDTIDVEDDEPIDPGPAPVTKARTTKARRVGNGKGAKRK